MTCNGLKFRGTKTTFINAHGDISFRRNLKALGDNCTGCAECEHLQRVFEETANRGNMKHFTVEVGAEYVAEVRKGERHEYVAFVEVEKREAVKA